MIVYERMPALGKVGAAIVPTAFEVAGLLGPILIGFASDKLFDARRMPACVISLLALTVCLALFVPAMTTGSIPIVVGLLFMMGLTLYGPDSMICGSAAIDFGTGEAAGTASGFVNGCGSVGAILGGLLPGYFDTYTVFIGFTVAALIATAVLLPHWNSRPDGVVKGHRNIPSLGNSARSAPDSGAPAAPPASFQARETLMHIERFEVVKRRAEMALHGNTLYIGGQVADDPTVTSRTRPARSWRTSTGCSRASAATAARCSRYASCSPTARTTPVSTRSGTSGFPRPGADPRL